MNVKENKKLYISGFVFALISAMLSLFCFGIEGIAVGAVSIILNIKHRKTHMVMFSTVLSVISILLSVIILAFTLYTCRDGYTTVDYWFIKLLT